MAPKAMKRPAAAPAAAGKRRKSQDPIQAKCATVASAVLEAEELPENVREMLANNLKETLGVMKADRHPYQEQVVVMVGETLTAIGERIAKAISDSDNELKDADSKKAGLDAALETANKLLEARSEIVKTKQSAVAEAAAAKKGNAAALKEAQKEEAQGNKELDEAGSKKEKLEGFRNGLFKELSERVATSQDLKVLASISKTHGYDNDLVKALTSAFGKGPDARGTFDKLVGTQLDDQMAKSLAELNETLLKGEPDKQARAAKVTAAQATYDASETALQACQDALSAAQAEESEASKGSKEANLAVTGFEPALQKTRTRCDELKQELIEFNEGALANFKELSVRAAEEPAPPAAEAGESAGAPQGEAA